MPITNPARKALNIIVSGNNDKYLEILNLNNFPNIKDGDKKLNSSEEFNSILSFLI